MKAVQALPDSPAATPRSPRRRAPNSHLYFQRVGSVSTSFVWGEEPFETWGIPVSSWRGGNDCGFELPCPTNDTGARSIYCGTRMMCSSAASFAVALAGTFPPRARR